MIETLIIISIVLLLVNLIFTIWYFLSNRKSSVSELQKALTQIESNLNRFDRSIQDDFQRNREESNKIARENREELSKGLKSFSETFSRDVKEFNELQRNKFNDLIVKQP